MLMFLILVACKDKETIDEPCPLRLFNVTIDNQTDLAFELQTVVLGCRVEANPLGESQYLDDLNSLSAVEFETGTYGADRMIVNLWDEVALLKQLDIELASEIESIEIRVSLVNNELTVERLP